MPICVLPRNMACETQTAPANLLLQPALIYQGQDTPPPSGFSTDNDGGATSMSDMTFEQLCELFGYTPKGRPLSSTEVAELFEAHSQSFLGYRSVTTKLGKNYSVYVNIYH